MTKKQKNIFIGIIIILAAVIILLVYILYSGGLRSESASIDQNATDWSLDAEQTESGQIQIPGYDEIVFKAGETSQQLTLYNPEGNPCYFKFTLYIDDEEEPVYETDMVEPGQAVSDITLSHSLESGDYRLNIHISTYDLETLTALNSAVSSADLKVQ